MDSRKYGLDKLPKWSTKDKLSARVKYYTLDRKRRHREEIPLRGWHNLRLYKDDKFLDDWIKEDDSISTMNVDRVHIDDLSVEEFMTKYEEPGVPVILKGCTEGWEAFQNWNFKDLLAKYKKCRLKVGEDDNGYPLKMKLKHFIEYIIFNKDDSPLYLFQSSIESRRGIKHIVKDYAVPKYFTDDYFKLLGTDDRPPYRWFLVGPKRSGTTIHVDPLSTSAWNASIQGHKKWILFPPEYERDFAKGKQYKVKGEDDEAIHYFKYIYPKILATGLVKKRYEFVQRPGETVYVPGLWWHCVLNLDDTIAITQNYCNRGNFERVWVDARKNRKKMACRWLRKMHKQEPELYKRAIRINKRDNFLMYDEARRKKVTWPYQEDSSSSSSSTSLSNYSYSYSDVSSENEEKDQIMEDKEE